MSPTNHLLRKWARWRRESRFPLVKVPFTVGPGPEYDGLFSYYDTEHDRLFLLPDIDRYGFFHEYGHVLDRHKLLDEHRYVLTGMLCPKQPRQWDWTGLDPATYEGPEPVMEVFADAYADLCMSRFKRPRLRRFLRKVLA